MYFVHEVYDRIGVKSNNILNLIEMWDGGPTEAHLYIRKEEQKLILCESIRHLHSKDESEFRYELTSTGNLQNIVKEIEAFCQSRYHGTLHFAFGKILSNTDAVTFLE